MGNDAAQRKKRSSKAKSMQKSGKQGKSEKPNTLRPPPTPQPQQRTAKPKSSKDKPMSAPSAPTDLPTSPNIFMTIKAYFIVSNISVNRRRQLAVSVEDITTIMKTTIREVVKSSLNANQRLTAVNITGIDENSIDGLSGSTIDSQLMLTEKCASNDCEAQLSNTTMNSTVISYMKRKIKNGNFDKVFQKNADAICANTTCQEIKDGTVVG